ncbi:hypothetical protein Lal_00037999, partial [Lupinus albus]
ELWVSDFWSHPHLSCNSSLHMLMEKDNLCAKFNGKNYTHTQASLSTTVDDKVKVVWNVKDAQVRTWILSSVESHIILNLRPHKTAKSMLDYLRKFHLEMEISNFQHGSLSIQEYYSTFLTLWSEYMDLY